VQSVTASRRDETEFDEPNLSMVALFLNIQHNTSILAAHSSDGASETRIALPTRRVDGPAVIGIARRSEVERSGGRLALGLPASEGDINIPHL
jgi:hypothetical protein